MAPFQACLKISLIVVLLSFLSSAAFATVGDPDPQFGTGGLVVTPIGSEAQGYAAVIQPDGKIVVVGSAVIDGQTHFAIARYQEDGTLDPLFVGDEGSRVEPGVFITRFSDSIYAEAHAVALQSDGKIVVAGFSDQTDVSRYFAVARYAAEDGKLDPGFEGGGKKTINFTTTDHEAAHAIAVRPDGKIVIAGLGVERESGDAVCAVVRLRADNGRTDLSINGQHLFRFGFPPSSSVARALAVYPDNRVVVVGHHYRDGQMKIAAARYAASGAFDESFGIGGKKIINIPSSSNEEAHAVALDNDGRISIAGYGNRTGTSNDMVLMRLQEEDGRLDPSFHEDGYDIFDLGSSVWDRAYAIALQPIGSIIIAGYSMTPDLYRHMAIVRRGKNGGRDESFGNRGTIIVGFGGVVASEAKTVLFQGEGKITVVGYVLQNGKNNFGLARYLGNPSAALEGRDAAPEATVASSATGATTTQTESGPREGQFGLGVDPKILPPGGGPPPPPPPGPPPPPPPGGGGSSEAACSLVFRATSSFVSLVGFGAILISLVALRTRRRFSTKPIFALPVPDRSSP